MGQTLGVVVPDCVTLVKNDSEKLMTKQLSQLSLELLGPLLIIKLSARNPFQCLFGGICFSYLVVARKTV